MNKPFLMLAAVIVFAACIPAVNSRADETANRDFTLKILPLLKDKCLGCHGGDPDDIKGDFSVLDREALLRGGESEEPAIVPGSPDDGTLIEAISWEGYEMPPKENDRLTGEQVELFREWIKKGAPWPDEETQAEDPRARGKTSSHR